MSLTPCASPLFRTCHNPSFPCITAIVFLISSEWRQGEPLALDAAAHGFVDGAQHVRPPSERLRPSSFGTTIAVWQSAGNSSLSSLIPIVPICHTPSSLYA